MWTSDQVSRPCPIVVVGQPRSGSTILTRYLNEFDGTFIVNDFYVLQKIDAAGLWGQLTPDEAQRIARWIYRILEIRCAQEVGKTLEQPVHLSLAQLAEVKRLVQAPWDEGLYWSDVLEKLLLTAAQLSGAKTWGWNTPQDHLHLERIFDAYPNAKVIAQLRAPEAVLKSYKNVHGWWHDARRYNPVAQAMAWKKSARSIQRWQAERPDDFLFLRFEEFVAHTKDQGAQIAQFLGFSATETTLDALGSNSSFSASRKRRPVTDMELMVARAIIAGDAESLGYRFRTPLKPSAAGVFELLKVLKNTVSIVLGVYLFDADKRTRVLALFKR